MTRFILVITLIATIPAGAFAQTQTTGAAVVSSGVRLARAEASTRTITQPKREKKSAIGWSIAGGIVAASAATALAAQSYGENEGGKFCTGCFLQWGAIAVPVGAGVGALVGLVIDAARR